MKKALRLIALFFMFASPSIAQPVSFGVKAGASMASLSSTFSFSGYHPDWNFGWNAGFFLDFDLADFVEVQPELQWIQKGQRDQTDHVAVTGGGGTIIGYTNLKNTYTLNYIEIPVVFRFHAPLDSGLQGNLQLGPTVGFLVNANNQYDAGAYGSGNQDQTSSYASLEAGFLFGAGLQAGSWLLDGRYERGLTPIGKDSGPNGAVNSLFTLQIGYQLF